ncbi:hypothetical protein JW926_07750 [Candidatus Sumerlaeota bacterium]|nr:hypothetical protein [Candidatus Sumerlaeota bacterium]
MTNEEINQTFQQIVALYKDKKYDQCLSMLDSMEASFPRNKDVLYHKALCLASLRRLEESMGYCQSLKGQFSDNRIEELEQWIIRNTPKAGVGQFQEVHGEGNFIQESSQRQTTTSAPQSKMFCTGCGAENDKNNYRCIRCGSILHAPAPAMQMETAASSPLLENLEKRANISFTTAIIGLVFGCLALALSAIIGAEGSEPSPPVAFLILGILFITFVFFMASVIYGFMGVKAANTVNRWKAIAGLTIGVLGIGSMACCFFLVLLALIAQFSIGEFPGGFKPR